MSAAAIQLVAVSRDDLLRLAQGERPAWTAGPVMAGAVAPPFVAERSLQQAGQGVPWRWCSSFHVVRRQDQAIVGGCGFKAPPQAGWVEVGYGIAPACRNQGFARMALQSLVERAFQVDEVQGVWAAVSPDNAASTRVVQALGFRSEGLFVDESGEALVRWVRPRG
jgi:RimJ/RimL family protein N-acetyltransferase